MNETETTLEEKELYCMTGVRQLLRILDIGLIVPELVACDEKCEIKLLTLTDLKSLFAINGCPVNPVLFEIDNKIEVKDKVISTTGIKIIHFENEDDLDDYMARGFVNVPNGIYNFQVSPRLFLGINADLPKITLNKLDRNILREGYRYFDVLSGLLWELVTQSLSVKVVNNLITRFGKKNGGMDTWLVKQCIDAGTDTNVSKVFLAYLKLLGEYDLDEGWVASEIIQELENRLSEDLRDVELISKWLKYSYGVVTNKSEMGVLSDEREIVLRAILLHLINPDIESINRMALREYPPGEKVLKTARLLAAARSGFSPMDAKDKEKFSGRYFLLADLMSSLVNGKTIDISYLTVAQNSHEKELLFWRNNYVALFEPDDEVTESNEVDQVLDLETIKLIMERVDKVDNILIENDQLIIILTKEESSNLFRKKHYFSLSLEQEPVSQIKMKSCLLGLHVGSQAKRLNERGRLQDAFRYQTEEQADFRFEYKPEECFSAVISIPATMLITDELLLSVLNRLIDCHIWLKEPVKLGKVI